MLTSRRLTGLAMSLGLAASATLAGTGTAFAQNVIPGDTNEGVVVRVQPDRATVVVNAHNGTANTVTGTFTNRTGSDMTCEGNMAGSNQPVDQRYAGAVAPATVVRDALSYYRTFTAHPRPGMAEAVTMAGSTININARMQEVPGLFPGGSIAPTFGPAFAAQAAIVEAYTEAKVHGQTGQVPRFNVNNGATHNWSATLGHATAGARQNFDAGVIFLCTAGPGLWAFAGYEAGTTPPVDNPRGNLQSGSLGRF